MTTVCDAGSTPAKGCEIDARGRALVAELEVV
jgi:hypothetical protein